MIATISKRFTFDAAHRLDGLSRHHKCGRMHGHTYAVELVLVGPVDANGFLVDYGAIAAAWESSVEQRLDHNVLNDVPGMGNPTTENLCRWIVEQLAPHPVFRTSSRVGDTHDGVPILRDTTLLERVRVYESSTTWCEVLVAVVEVPKTAASATHLKHHAERTRDGELTSYEQQQHVLRPWALYRR